MDENILELIDISKEFPGVKALDNVNLTIKRGEIHAIVGENGAGKSTMMKILSGVYPYGTYTGTLKFLGEERKFHSIRESEEAGIAIIYQELALVRQMNIAENIFLGNEMKSHGSIDWSKTMAEATRCLSEVGLNINPMTKVINLGVGQQQLVEIAKALSKNAKLLILDEPTAPLTDSETDNLLNIMLELKEKGVTCVFITHKLEEVYRVCDTITVIRDGKAISTDPSSELSENDMIARMVGRDMTERFPYVEHKIGEPFFRVKNLTFTDPELSTRKLVENVSFDLHRGEILGIAGLMGAGRTELAMSIFGCYKKYVTGTIEMDGKELSINEPRQAILQGISYLSEDRKKYGFNMLMDIEDNISMAALEKISKFGIVDNSQKVATALKYIDEMKIKTPSTKQMVVNLSGGNQQKVVLGKWLMTEPKVLILDEPTRGIDIGAKYEIYNIMNNLILQGVSIIMISSELPEIIGMCDRVLIMHEGKLTGSLDKEELSQELIMKFAIGENKDGK